MTMKRYRKKPVVIEAVQWFCLEDMPEVVKRYDAARVMGRLCDHCGGYLDGHGWVGTLEGVGIVCPGDWIITGIKGERYPCKPDIFDATYELVEETTT